MSGNCYMVNAQEVYTKKPTLNIFKVHIIFNSFKKQIKTIFSYYSVQNCGIIEYFHLFLTNKLTDVILKANSNGLLSKRGASNRCEINDLFPISVNVSHNVPY